MRLGIILIILIMGLQGCKKKDKEPEDLLLRIGDRELTTGEVIDLIPEGLHPADSLNLFNSIIENWIKDVVLSDFAEKRLFDTSLIDRQVKDYRNKLIVQEYLLRMSESQRPKVDEKAVREYYETHKQDLKTEIPLIKGVFLKINSESKGKEEIKKLLSDIDDKNIDILEKKWLDNALAYDYFKDRWIDWETITSMIPYRFGDADLFLSGNRYFETDYDDCTYYLQISDYLPSGSQQPFEYASHWITGLLGRVELSEYEKQLVEGLVKKSIEENKLEAIGYDPLTHKMVSP